MKKFLKNFRFVGLLLLLGCNTETKDLIIVLTDGISADDFAIRQLVAVLEEKGIVGRVGDKGAFEIRLSIEKPEISEEGYHIRLNGNQGIDIVGTDPTGLLYGIYALEEQLSNGVKISSIKAEEVRAALPFRAIKFNLPWDSYRRSEALQLHTETVRDIKFWESFLDMMARNRFNVLTLWNLHPFNYMIRPKNFPEATAFSDDELAEWQEFWKSLFAMARERGIETYLVNWNIFVSPEFAEANDVATYSIEGNYFSDGDTSAIIKTYTREAVKQVLEEYPDLTGIGVSLGEGMGGMTPREREEWILETVIAGMKEVDRPVKLIHRAPFSANLGSGGSADKSTEMLTRAALDTLSGLEPPIYVEAKFNWSHAHSTPKLVKVHGGPLTDTYWNPEPENFKMTWMMRNEDFFALRWGQANFIREHISRNTPSYVAGYYVGSECYIPAVDYFTKLEGDVAWNYAFERQWLFYKIWGNLLYNPDTPDDVFEKDFDRRFPGKGKQLFQAYQMASKVPLHIASLWDVAWDYTLYSEGFLSIDPDGVTNLISIKDLINRKTTDPDYMNVRDFVNAQLSDMPIPENRIHPHLLAEKLETDAMEVFELIKSMDNPTDLNLLYEVSDLKIWANLGLYLAYKLRAAVDLTHYMSTGETEKREESVAYLEKAVSFWDELIEISQPIYKEMPLVHHNRADVRGKHFHWSLYREEVLRDLDYAKNLTFQNSNLK